MADDLQALVMHQARELEQLRAQQQRQTIDTAIGAAIDSSGVELVGGAARQQLAELLRGDVAMVPHNGATVAAGPGLQPLDAMVKERLSRPEYAHFVRGKSPAPVAGQQPAQQPHGGLLPAPTDGAIEPVGVRIVRAAAEQRAAAQARGGAAMDMTQKFGLSLPTNRR